MKTDSRKLLEKIHIFAGLEDDFMDHLAHTCKPLCFAAGRRVVEEGAPGREMFLIASGGVDVVKRIGRPRETILARLSPGEFFGEGCILECLPRMATIRTNSDTLLYSLSCDELHHLFKKSPSQYAILILNISRGISHRLRSLDEVYAARA